LISLVTRRNSQPHFSSKVEHAITEVTHGGLDLIELMIKQAIAQGTADRGLHPDSPEMQQSTYHDLFIKSARAGMSSAIEGRIYSENPYEGFVPSTGLLQHVSFGKEQKWLRVDTWVCC
jgi:urea carboxylase